MDDRVAAIYKMLWESSFTSVSQGDIDIDPYIANPGSDQRRGMTLVFRPSPGMKTIILNFLDELRILEPGQYYYLDSNLHFTVLSLFTAIPNFQPQYDRLDEYEAAVKDAVKDSPAFSMQIAGLTISKSAVMLCGFPDSGILNGIRQTLRQNLVNRGLAQGLDKRYILVAAHTTILRFSVPLRNPAIFSQFLAANRERIFGSFQVTELQLVKNDWYMSQQHTPIINRYPLHIN
jgi:2'-5' RNA ligase